MHGALRYAAELRRSARAGDQRNGVGCTRWPFVRLLQSQKRSRKTFLLGSRWIRDLGEAVGGGHVRDAVRRWRGTPHRDYSAGVERVVERHRPGPGEAAQAL